MVSTRSQGKNHSKKEEKIHQREESQSKDESKDESPPKQKKQRTEDSDSLQGSGERPSDEIGGLLLEYAKSGKAHCRSCDQLIDKDTPRVGMEAFITGRVSMTWQHIDCFIKNQMEVEYAKSSQGKCSLTGKNFEKGEPKLKVTSHTASRSYALCCIPEVFSAVLSWAPSSLKTDADSLYSYIKGTDDLNDSDVDELKKNLGNIDAKSSSTRGDLADKEDQAKPAEDRTKNENGGAAQDAVDENGKPKKGKVAHQDGKVEWKWAGGKYDGTLLPNKETEDKAFAKTHNGNIKTLNKGKDYWNMKT